MNHRVFFYEVFAEEEQSLRRQLPANLNAEFSPFAIQESGHVDPPADVISIRTQSVIPIPWASILKAVLSRSAGFDHLSRFKELTHTTARFGHLFRYSGQAVAEQAAMLWMCLLRKLPKQIESARSFSRDGLTGRECSGKTVSIFGVGDIGHHVAQVARGFNMHVLGIDVVQRHSGIQYVSAQEGLSRADVIVCAMNLTGENLGYFSYEKLSTCRDGAIFVNIARGEFVRSRDLIQLLDEGKLGGVGLDVFPEETKLGPALRENQPAEYPDMAAFQDLSRRTNVILTPHNAFNTLEAVERKSAQTAQQLDAFFKHGKFLDTSLLEH